LLELLVTNTSDDQSKDVKLAINDNKKLSYNSSLPFVQTVDSESEAHRKQCPGMFWTRKGAFCLTAILE